VHELVSPEREMLQSHTQITADSDLARRRDLAYFQASLSDVAAPISIALECPARTDN